MDYKEQQQIKEIEITCTRADNNKAIDFIK